MCLRGDIVVPEIPVCARQRPPQFPLHPYTVNQEAVLAALNHFKDIYVKLPPYQRRELIGLVLLKAEVTENQLRLSFHGRPAAPEVFEKISAPGARAPRRAEPFEWLRR